MCVHTYIRTVLFLVAWICESVDVVVGSLVSSALNRTQLYYLTYYFSWRGVDLAVMKGVSCLVRECQHGSLFSVWKTDTLTRQGQSEIL